MGWRLWREGAGARTTGDDRFEVDDRVGEGGAVEGLAGHLECREEEWSGHRREASGRKTIEYSIVDLQVPQITS